MASGPPGALPDRIRFSGRVRITGLLLQFCSQWREADALGSVLPSPDLGISVVCCGHPSSKLFRNTSTSALPTPVPAWVEEQLRCLCVELHLSPGKSAWYLQTWV